MAWKPVTIISYQKLRANFGEDGKDELHDDKIRQVVLNGTTPTAIADPAMQHIVTSQQY